MDIFCPNILLSCSFSYIIILYLNDICLVIEYSGGNYICLYNDEGMGIETSKTFF